MTFKTKGFNDININKITEQTKAKVKRRMMQLGENENNKR